MTENNRTIIANFEEKLYKLVFEYKFYKEANEKMVVELQEKEEKLKELQKSCSETEWERNI